VRVDDWDRFIGALSATGQAQEADDDHDDFPRTVADGLRGLGYEPAPPAANQAKRRAG